MPGDWTSRCGGISWRTRPDWSIELPGGEVPVYESGSPSHTIVQNVWRHWKSIIRSTAKRTGIPPSWLVGFISAETGRWSKDPWVQASCGPWSTTCHNPCCAGLMQINVLPSAPIYRIVGGYSDPKEMLDPKKNVNTGAKLLARNARAYNWELPALAASYNAGSVSCADGSRFGMKSDPSYIDRVVAFNNTAVLQIGANAPTPVLAYAGAGVGIAAAGFLLVPRLLKMVRR